VCVCVCLCVCVRVSVCLCVCVYLCICVCAFSSPRLRWPEPGTRSMRAMPQLGGLRVVSNWGPCNQSYIFQYNNNAIIVYNPQPRHARAMPRLGGCASSGRALLYIIVVYCFMLFCEDQGRELVDNRHTLFCECKRRCVRTHLDARSLAHARTHA
jgi:hypothetical protein